MGHVVSLTDDGRSQHSVRYGSLDRGGRPADLPLVLHRADAEGEPVGNAARRSTVRFAVMPEPGKTRIMDVVERAARSLLEQRPGLENRGRCSRTTSNVAPK